MKRRELLAGLVGSCVVGPQAWAHQTKRVAHTVSLLHTNDTHSRIEPFTRGRYKGMGGVSRRATLISSLKKANPSTLVVDAGDIFQGTPYFNMFKGEVELRAMSMAGYDLATLGNHDFDLGAQWLLKMAHQHARFPFVSANLTFSQPEAQKLIRPYHIRTFAGWKVGFIGLGVRFKGLTAAHLHQGVRYVEPIAVAKKLVHQLRVKMGCDAVVVLSHLGYTGFDGEPGDLDLARLVPGIDVIIGGHTHTFLHQPKVVVGANQHKTYIAQVGHSGIYLGHINLVFSPGKKVSVQSKVHPIR